jgi:hypothetical protein
MTEQKYTLREKLQIKLEGGPADTHEIDAAVLGEALLAISGLAQRTNSFLRGRDALVTAKVEAGFQGSSFLINLLIDYFGPMATHLQHIPQVVEAIKSLINLKIFLKGKPPQRVEPAQDGGVMIQNSQGDNSVVNQYIYNMNINGPINNELAKVCKVFEAGITRASLSGGDRPDAPTVIEANQKNSIIPPGDSFSEEAIATRQLEVVTPNLDGSPGRWRFYDPENDVTFTADVSDGIFLSDVRDKKYDFRSGDLLTVNMKEIKKMVSQRKRTARDVVEVLSFERPEAA